MEELIAELSDGLETACSAHMLVLTNEKCFFGASVIAYPGVLEKAAELLGGDVMILPSSVHEVIAIPAEGADPKALREMVKSINEAIVSPEDRLTDSVYRYSVLSGIFESV